jgi:hypothetical protein
LGQERQQCVVERQQCVVERQQCVVERQCPSLVGLGASCRRRPVDDGQAERSAATVPSRCCLWLWMSLLQG